MNKTPVIIDCDTGRDDALSIWLALALDLPLQAIVTSYGNTSVENVSDNTCRVLALAGREDIPVWQGAAAPSASHSGYKNIVIPRQEKAGNGLCNLEFPQSAQKAEICDASMMAQRLSAMAEKSGAIDYIILGPATNFAAICRALGDTLATVIKSVTMMGGKLAPLWQEMPGADFNFVCDPYAVSDVLLKARAAAVPVRFVPMNVTWPIYLGLGDLENLQASHEISQASKALMIAHARHFAPEPVFRFHDPCVLLTFAYPAFFNPMRVTINCDENSDEFGRLSSDEGGLVCEVFEADTATRRAFLEKVLSHLGLQQS